MPDKQSKLGTRSNGEVALATAKSNNRLNPACITTR